MQTVILKGNVIRQTEEACLLIDGAKLANLMIEYEVGINVEKVYTVKEIDKGYFPGL